MSCLTIKQICEWIQYSIRTSWDSAPSGVFLPICSWKLLKRSCIRSYPSTLFLLDVYIYKYYLYIYIYTMQPDHYLTKSKNTNPWKNWAWSNHRNKPPVTIVNQIQRRYIRDSEPEKACSKRLEHHCFRPFWEVGCIPPNHHLVKLIVGVGLMKSYQMSLSERSPTTKEWKQKSTLDMISGYQGF